MRTFVDNLFFEKVNKNRMVFHNKTAQEVLLYLNSSKEGLTSEVANSRLANGQNMLETGKKQSNVSRFFGQFKDIMVIILLIASVVSLIFAIVKHSQTELIDSIIIFGIVLLNATLGFVQELKAENALNSLKKMSQPYSLCIRDGSIQKVPTKDIVPGDIVVLEAGDIVPADIYLLESNSLKCDESALTGESIPAEKVSNVVLPEKTSLADRKNMCFSSSIVSYGRGVGVVVATGKNAQIGKIATMIDNGTKSQTPLQKNLNHLGEIITFIVLSIAIVIFSVDAFVAKQGFIESFLTAIAIAVAAIPESLPAVVTIILSIGVTKLAKKNAIIRRLHAVETLGCCEVICSDKTGTITKNQMTVREVCCGKGEFFEETFDDILRCMCLCNDARKSGKDFVGDPTETALLRFAVSKGYLQNNIKRLAEKPFDSSRKLMTTVVQKDNKITQWTKGALDVLLKSCSHIMLNNQKMPLTEQIIREIEVKNRELCSKEYRVLGFAKKENICVDNVEESDLTFLGFCGMIDPPREEVFEAIKKCKRAGIRTIMITGDHQATATAVAMELGIIFSPKEVLNGDELERMSDEKLCKIISKVSVFSRVTPEHKVRIVKAIQNNGKIVAMTGDGVNDAPSIKSANIGIGMGKNGTEVTKEVADVILTDDNFATIVVAVEEGRRIFGNIQKTIQFLLSCNIAEVLALFLVTILFPANIFLNAVQILFINLVTDTLPSVALGVDMAQDDLMSSLPRNQNSTIIGGKVGLDILYQGIAQTLIVIATYLLGIYVFHSPQVATTMSFLTVNLIQLFHMFNVRSHKSIFCSNPFKNKVLLLSLFFGISILLSLALIPTVRWVFGLATLTPLQWVLTLGLSLFIIPICEVEKCITRAIFKRKKNN